MAERSQEIMEIISDKHKAIVDEYYANGYVGYKAVMAYIPDIHRNNASSYFTMLAKTPEMKAYIEQKSNVLRAETQIKAVQVLRELILMGYSDITDYMSLSEAELKALPPELRRCISSFKKKTVRYLPRGAKPGEEVEETNVEIKLFDKLKALEMVNKHIGFYSEDNKQKSSVNIDLSKADKVQLNVLLNLITEDK